VRSKVLQLAIIFEGGLLALALGLGWLLGVPPWSQTYWEVAEVLRGALATAPPLLGMWWASRSRWGPLQRVMREVKDKIVPIFLDSTISDLAAISVVAGIGEEALFRGVIQAALSEWLNPSTGLLIASALFGLGHLLTPGYGVLAGLLGLYLGGLFMAFENLLLVMVVHGVYDFLTLVYLMRRRKV